MGRADQGTVIHALLVMLTTGSRQFVEQHLCVLQIGGVEALGELAVNGRQQLARFGPPTLFGPQLGEIVAARNSHDWLLLRPRPKLRGKPAHHHPGQ